MQTFAPLGRNIRDGFYTLDDKRLGKQRVETYQILRTLVGISEGWRSHPATKMWVNDVGALARYGEVNCEVWRGMGYADSLYPAFRLIRETYQENYGIHSIMMPEWLDDIAPSHRANLIHKAPELYGHLWPEDASYIPYYWHLPCGEKPTSSHTEEQHARARDRLGRGCGRGSACECERSRSLLARKPRKLRELPVVHIHNS